MIGYWLIPADEQKATLASIIRKLAQRYDAQVFEPHVTLYSTDDSEERACRIVERVSEKNRPLHLRIRGIIHSEKFTKTLFIQFASNAEAQRLSDEIRESSRSGSGYELDPHLSLLYADIPAEAKAAEARRIDLPFGRAAFDSVAAIYFPRPIESRVDVEAWRTIATAKLGGSNGQRLI